MRPHLASRSAWSLWVVPVLAVSVGAFTQNVAAVQSPYRLTASYFVGMDAVVRTNAECVAEALPRGMVFGLLGMLCDGDTSQSSSHGHPD